MDAADVLPSARHPRDRQARLNLYAAAGLPRYWILDLDERTLHAYTLDGNVFRLDAQLDDDHPDGEVETGAGSVRMSLPDLIREPPELIRTVKPVRLDPDGSSART